MVGTARPFQLNGMCKKKIDHRFAAAYMTRVKISVRAGDNTNTRGCGSGEATAPTPGQAHNGRLKLQRQMRLSEHSRHSAILLDCRFTKVNPPQKMPKASGESISAISMPEIVKKIRGDEKLASSRPQVSQDGAATEKVYSLGKAVSLRTEI